MRCDFRTVPETEVRTSVNGAGGMTSMIAASDPSRSRPLSCVWPWFAWAECSSLASTQAARMTTAVDGI